MFWEEQDMDEKKEELRRKLKEALQKKYPDGMTATPPPRYDEVYVEGVKWLDSLEKGGEAPVPSPPREAVGPGPTAYDLKGRCPCYTCQDQPELGWDNPVNKYMIVCHQCGNKRCSHATHHDLPCNNSNEPGQPGSRYPALKMDE